MVGWYARGMLATGFNLCQGGFGLLGHEIAQLAAGAQYVAATALADECVDAGMREDRLECMHAAIGGPPKNISGKFIEGNQIHFAAEIFEQLDQSMGVFVPIIDAGEQYIFEREPSGRGERVAAAGSHERLE